MGADAAESVKWWARVAIAALLAAGALVITLVAAIAFPARSARLTDERLLGTWQSDADRTVVGIREQRPVDEREEAALRKLFGCMRVTYTLTTYTTEWDGTNESHAYDVLGKDKRSVVIREVRRKPLPLDEALELSEFMVIHFEGRDSYWLYTQVGGVREYFKRVQQPQARKAG